MFPFTRATHFGVTPFLTHSQSHQIGADPRPTPPKPSPPPPPPAPALGATPRPTASSPPEPESGASSARHRLLTFPKAPIGALCEPGGPPYHALSCCRGVQGHLLRPQHPSGPLGLMIYLASGFTVDGCGIPSHKMKPMVETRTCCVLLFPSIG